MSKLEELVRNATFPLTDAAGGLLGTGFFIAPGVAVTAVHVVNEGWKGPIFGRNRGGTLQRVTVVEKHPPDVAPGVETYPLPDLALLRVNASDFADSAAVFLADPTDTPRIMAIGFSGSVDRREEYGPDVALLECEGVVTQSGTRLIKVKLASLDPGMSGAPVLDAAQGAVVGFVKASRGVGKPHGGYVVAAGELQTNARSVWAESELHHRSNHAWRSARARDNGIADPADATRALIDVLANAPDARGESLPPGVDAAALHQTVWLRRRFPNTPQAQPSIVLRQRWRTDRPLTGLTVIVGDPGYGKSWLLAHHVAQAAKNAKHRLAAGEDPSSSVVPLRISCTGLALAPPEDDAPVGLARALLAAAPLQDVVDFRNARSLVDAVAAAFAEGRLLVCLDGLDEMASSSRRNFKRNLGHLLGAGNAVLLGTRPVAIPVLDDIGVSNRDDFELAGFSPREVVNYVRAWHVGNVTEADTLLRALGDHSQLERLAAVPLLLSFFCRLALSTAGPEYNRATDRSLYRDVVTQLLSGRWRAERTALDSSSMPDAVLRLRLIAQVIGELQDIWRGGVEDIPVAELRSKIRSHPDYDAVSATASARMHAVHAQAAIPEPTVDPVLWELLHDGLLVEARGASLRPTVRFIHPVLRETILAEYFAGLAPDERLDCVDRHRWFDPSWSRVIVQATASLPDASAVIRHLASSRPDPWLTQRTLAAQALAARARFDDNETSRELLESLVREAGSNWVFDRRRAVEAIGVLIGSTSDYVHQWGRERLSSAKPGTRTASPGGRNQASQTAALIDAEVHREILVGLLARADDLAMSQATALVGSADCPQQLRARLIGALVAVDTPEASAVILDRLQASGTREDLQALLGALRPHSRHGIDIATQILSDRQVLAYARALVGDALLECGEKGVTPVKAVAEDSTMDQGVRCRLYAAMLRAAVPGAVPGALQLLNDVTSQFGDRALLTLALVEDGVAGAVQEAALLLANPHVDWGFREALARALARQGDVGRGLLRAQMNHSALDLGVKVRHVCALVEIRDPEGQLVALRLHRDQGVPIWIRSTLSMLLLSNNVPGVDEEALIRLVKAPGLAREHRVNLAVELARAGSDAAESLLVDALRDNGTELVSWPEAAARLAEAGRTAERCLATVASATHLSWPVRCDALIYLGKIASPGSPALAFKIAADFPDIWRSRLVFGLARAGLAPDVDDLADIARKLHGGYRMLHEFLLRGVFDEQLRDRLLGVAAELHERGSTEHKTDGPELQINEELLDELGIETHSATVATDILQWIYDLLELRVGASLAGLMLAEQRDEFEHFVEHDDRVAAFEYLQSELPEYRAMVLQTYEELTTEIREGRLVPPVLAGQKIVDSKSVLGHIGQLSRLLSEWIEHARGGAWDRWLRFAEANEAVLGSPAALSVLDAATEVDPTWGYHEAMLFAATQIGDDGLESGRLTRFSALLDWLKGALAHKDYYGVLCGGLFATTRFPFESLGWLYAGVGAHLLSNGDLADELLRAGGGLLLPAQREEGSAVLAQLQSTLGWTDDDTERLVSSFRSGTNNRPLEHYENAVENSPDNVTHQYNLGVAQQRAGDHVSAAESYARAAELDPANPAPHRARANAMVWLDRHDEALASITSALHADSFDPQSHALLGQILTKLGEHADAVEAFKEATRLSPSNAQYYSMLAESFQNAGEPDLGIEAMDAALELQPSPRMRRAYAHVIDGAGHFVRALEVIDALLASHPGDAMTYASRGYVLNHMGRHEDAVDALTQAAELDPDSGAIRANRAEALLLVGRLSESAIDFRETLRIGSINDIESHALLALALHEADPAECKRHAQLSLEVPYEATISPFRHGELRALSQLVVNQDAAAALDELAQVLDRRRPNDLLAAPMYALIRAAVGDNLVDTLLAGLRRELDKAFDEMWTDAV